MRISSSWMSERDSSTAVSVSRRASSTESPRTSRKRARRSFFRRSSSSGARPSMRAISPSKPARMASTSRWVASPSRARAWSNCPKVRASKRLQHRPQLLGIGARLRADHPFQLQQVGQAKAPPDAGLARQLPQQLGVRAHGAAVQARPRGLFQLDVLEVQFHPAAQHVLGQVAADLRLQHRQGRRQVHEKVQEAVVVGLQGHGELALLVPVLPHAEAGHALQSLPPSLASNARPTFQLSPAPMVTNRSPGASFPASASTASSGSS